MKSFDLFTTKLVYEPLEEEAETSVNLGLGSLPDQLVECDIPLNRIEFYSEDPTRPGHLQVTMDNNDILVIKDSMQNLRAAMKKRLAVIFES